MAGELQPLAQNFKVVDENGFPTLYFIKWAQQRQIDISEGITLVDLQAYLTAHALREGSGIQFTPSGDLNDSPLIAADVQEILDQISATRGTILYRGLLGWAPLAPGTATYLLQTNGAGADPTWVAPPSGGGGGMALIQTKIFNGTTNTFTFSGIPNTYKNLQVEMIGRTVQAAVDQPTIQINGLATAIYDQQRTFANGGGLNGGEGLGATSWNLIAALPGTLWPAQHEGHNILDILDYNNATFYKQMRFEGRQPSNSANGSAYYIVGNGQARDINPITSVTVNMPTNFANGSRAFLYGY